VDAPQAPAAPDPAKTAAAQAQSNKETAVAQYGLNATNQVTPQGSLSYKQIGTWADGTPRFEATTAYSPEQQSLYNKSLVTQGNLADIGNQQSAKIGSLLNTPVNLSTATEGKIDELGRARLDPQFAREGAALDTQLINKGVRPGSQAWNDAHTQFSQQKNDAYNQLYLSGRGQGAQEALTERNQPINEISALLSGSQVSQPSFTNTPQPGVAPTDVIGAQQQSLNQQNVGFNAQQTQNNALMSGLFGLGSAALGGWGYGGFKTSDRRAKTDIKKVGELDNGQPVYKYRYKGSGLMELGLMAQDVEKDIPEAVVTTPSGLMAVNYDRATEAA
jgi:hypothetical protein